MLPHIQGATQSPHLCKVWRVGNTRLRPTQEAAPGPGCSDRQAHCRGADTGALHPTAQLPLAQAKAGSEQGSKLALSWPPLSKADMSPQTRAARPTCW